MQCTTLTTPSRNSITDALEIFNGYPVIECLRGLYKLFANYMVSVRSKPLFFLTTLAEQALRGVCAFGLQLCPKPTVAVAQALHLGTGVHVPFAITGYLDYPHIHAQPTERLTRGRFLNIDGGEQVPLTIPQQEVGLALPALEHGARSIVTYKGNEKPAFDSPNGHIGGIPAQDAVIIGDRTEWAELPLHFLIQLIGIRHFGYEPHHHLSSKAASFSSRVIDKFMQGVLLKGVIIPRGLTNLVSCFVSKAQRFQEGIRLFWSRLQLHRNGQLHTLIIPKIDTNVKNGQSNGEECRDSSPYLKKGVSDATDLR